MANISSAFGTLTIRSKSEEVVRTLCDLIKSTEDRWAYPTYLDGDCVIDQDESGIYFVETPFTGVGRNCYLYNIEDFPSSLSIDFAKWGYTSLPVEQRLIVNAWEILFEYTDEESGCDVLYTETARLAHEAGTSIDSTKHIVEAHEDYDHTIGNLVRLDCRESVDDCVGYMETCCGGDQEELRYEIEQSKDQLCEDLGKSWEELLSENPFLKTVWEGK